MTSLIQTLRNLGVVRLAALGVVGLGLIAFFVYLATRLSTPDMTLLYGDLETTDSSQIVSRLEAMKVPYALRGDGSQILVPSDQVLRLRMSMAENGLPSGGSIGYEIFDKTDALGTTNFVQQVNHLRALEGELARTIKSISQIRSARVHLVIPEHELFSRDKPQPSASIILMMQGGATLEKSQVLAIQHLVAAAVPGLKPSAVSIVDNHGTLLARGPEDGDGSLTGATADEMRIAYETRAARAIEDLLQRTLGYGKVRAQVTADMDFDRVTTNSETYDPDGQVVRSTQTVDDKSDSTEGTPPDPVTVASNLPSPPGAASSGPQSNNRTARSEETVNYEISKKVETHVREAGNVRRLSAAVLVDGNYTTAADGTVSYAPRSAEELAQIEKLVRSAIGYDESRGDTVEVVNMRFADAEEAQAAVDADTVFGLEKTDLLRIAEMLVLGIVAVLVLLLVVRPLLNRLLEAPVGRPAEAQALLTDQSMPLPALAAPPPVPAAAGQLATAMAAPSGNLVNEIEQMIDLNQVEGRVRASSVKKIGEIVEKHPEEAVNIIRSWMFQES